MSAPFCAALAWIEGTASFAGMRNFTNRAVLDLIPRIHIVADESRPRYEPHLRVVTDDGSIMEWEDTSGEEGYRLNWDAAVMMTHQLCDEVDVPSPLADSLIEQAATAEKLPNAKVLIDAVCAAAFAGRSKRVSVANS